MPGANTETAPILAVNLFRSLLTPILTYGSQIWYSLVNQQLKEKLVTGSLPTNWLGTIRERGQNQGSDHLLGQEE